MNKKKILVIDDESKIIEFVESYLINYGYEVESALTGYEALTIFDKKAIDMVLLDLMLPDISGESVCKKIRETSSVPIIMLTAKIDEEAIINGLKIGADDYITKPFSPRQLIARVEALFRRTELMTTEKEIYIYNDGDLIINQENYSITKTGVPIDLTPTEFRLLLTLAKRPQKVFTREELIEIAFEGNFEGYTRTIDSHIKNLRVKLEEDTKLCSYIVTVRGIGYRFGCD